VVCHEAFPYYFPAYSKNVVVVSCTRTRSSFAWENLSRQRFNTQVFRRRHSPSETRLRPHQRTAITPTSINLALHKDIQCARFAIMRCRIDFSRDTDPEHSYGRAVRIRASSPKNPRVILFHSIDTYAAGVRSREPVIGGPASSNLIPNQTRSSVSIKQSAKQIRGLIQPQRCSFPCGIFRIQQFPKDPRDISQVGIWPFSSATS